jgi:hypothetical protein
MTLSGSARQGIFYEAFFIGHFLFTRRGMD